ncbi:MAG: 3-deoxy-manno-octulosonate cytidylyltransferase [Proteobacteria bacterium]|nr:3-deoxy-manno-octulosonate cytidylyltransferase [Pseudomonadota bacterium]
MKPTIVICIPARYQSNRLPGKPLIKIAHKELILWALESASKINVEQVIVATDDKRIFKLVCNHGYQAIMTNDKHRSGTDRLAEVAQSLQWADETIVINYQGDEPMTPTANIQQLINALIDNPTAAIATLYQPIKNFNDLLNPNNVKLITDNNDYALYFSRSPIPYSRQNFTQQKLDKNIDYKQHIGLYAYRASFLKIFTKLTPSVLEKSESLEQLRALFHGYKIIAKKASKAMPHGIDTQQDLQAFEKMVNKKNLPN